MIELIIGGLIVLAMLICLAALFQPMRGEDGEAGRFLGRDDLIELVSSLPAGSKIYITIEKP